MITIVTVWLCLITHVACDVVITVNNNGSVNDTCCVNGTCPCSSLSSALHNLSDNTVINITSESVTLHDIVGMGSGNLSKITITGNDATIMCNNTGGVYCESCSDITIMGITWYQCGGNDSEILITWTVALAFINSSEILIQNCTFQNSSYYHVYMENAKGMIVIKESNFIKTDFYCDFSTALHISYTANTIITIKDSMFDGNGCTDIESSCVCFGVWIESNNNNVECSQFLLENTIFSNYTYGLSFDISVGNAVITLLNVYVYNNALGGVSIGSEKNKGANNSFVSLNISSATFIDNEPALHVDYADTVIISSATFIQNSIEICVGTITVSSSNFINNDIFMTANNTVSISHATFMNTGGTFSIITDDDVSISSTTFIDSPSLISSNGQTVSLSIEIDNCTFNAFNDGFYDGGISIKSAATLTMINVSNSFFHNNQSRAVNIQTSISTECITARIVFANVNIYNSIQSTDTSVYIGTENTVLLVTFEKVNFLSNHLIRNTETLLINSNQFNQCSSGVTMSIQLTDCTFYENYALDHVVAMSITADENRNYYDKIGIKLSNCKFDNNFGGKSIVYINVPLFISEVSMILNNSTFSNNKGTALHLIFPEFKLEGNILFINNSAYS